MYPSHKNGHQQEEAYNPYAGVKPPATSGSLASPLPSQSGNSSDSNKKSQHASPYAGSLYSNDYAPHSGTPSNPYAAATQQKQYSYSSSGGNSSSTGSGSQLPAVPAPRVPNISTAASSKYQPISASGQSNPYSPHSPYAATIVQARAPKTGAAAGNLKELSASSNHAGKPVAASSSPSSRSLFVAQKMLTVPPLSSSASVSVSGSSPYVTSNISKASVSAQSVANSVGHGNANSAATPPIPLRKARSIRTTRSHTTETMASPPELPASREFNVTAPPFAKIISRTNNPDDLRDTVQPSHPIANAPQMPRIDRQIHQPLSSQPRYTDPREPTLESPYKAAVPSQLKSSTNEDSGIFSNPSPNPYVSQSFNKESRKPMDLTSGPQDTNGRLICMLCESK